MKTFETYWVDKKGCNELDVFHEVISIKQFSLGHGGDSCNRLTHHRLLW